MRRFLPLAAVVVWPAVARADVHVGVEAVTDVPVNVGARAWVELPYGIRISTGLGVMPSAYVDLINLILVDAGAYSQETGDVIGAAIENALLWRTHVGWRHGDSGFYVEGGYALATLGGGLTGEEVLRAVTGVDRPAEATEAIGFTAGAMVHMIDAEIGWVDRVWEGLTVRVALGFAGTVAADAVVEPDRAPRGPVARAYVDELSAAGATYIESQLTSYVFTPTITVALGWQFL